MKYETVSPKSLFIAQPTAHILSYLIEQNQLIIERQ